MTGPAGFCGCCSRPLTMPGRRWYGARSRRTAATRRLFARRRRRGQRSTYSSRRTPALAALTKRVKESFDPKGVPQSRARMWAGVLSQCRRPSPLPSSPIRTIAESEKILRACVHCGFCTATCPTYVLLGDELDSPRGRIYLIKDMLENDRPATAEVVKHIDRCLSCLACMTTCPSGVHYMHLVDHARVHIEKTYRRPLADRWLRAVLAQVLPDNRRFRLALARRWSRQAVRAACWRSSGSSRLAAMLRLAPARLPRAAPQAAARSSRRRGHAGAASRCWPAASHPVIWRRRSTRRRSACSPATASRSCCAAGAGLLRRARPSHGPRAARRSRRRAPISMPGLPS